MQTVLAASVANSVAAAGCLARCCSRSDSFAALPASQGCVQPCLQKVPSSGLLHHRLEPDAAVLKDAWEPFAPSSNFFWTLSTWSTRSAASSFASLRPISLTAVVMTCSTTSGSLWCKLANWLHVSEECPKFFANSLQRGTVAYARMSWGAGTISYCTTEDAVQHSFAIMFVRHCCVLIKHGMTRCLKVVPRARAILAQLVSGGNVDE